MTLEYEVPGDDKVHAALSRLGKLPLRKAFYEGLQNPFWVDKLAQLGAFDNPPDSQVSSEGYVVTEYWPEIDYLTRMAPLVSSSVCEVFEVICASKNEWVRRGIMEAMSRLDPQDAAKLVATISTWPNDKIGNFRIDPEHISNAIVALLAGGEHCKGLQLAEAYFSPREGEKKEFGNNEPTIGFEHYFYQENLTKITEFFGTSKITTLSRWLCNYQIFSGSYSESTQRDMSSYWRPEITKEEDHSHHYIGNALINELIDALQNETTNFLTVMQHQLNSSHPVIRRIALSVLTERINSIEDKTLEHTNHLSIQEQEIASLAELVIEDSEYLRSAYRAEFFPFIRACVSWKNKINLNSFYNEVRKGPEYLNDDRRERLRQESETSEEFAERTENMRGRWQQELLTLAENGDMPDELKSILDIQNKKFGPIEIVDVTTRVQTKTGPTSATSFEEMQGMHEDELFELLLSWHPEENDFMGDTHEGQGRILTRVISANPNLFSNLDKLKQLRPTYIRAVFEGWNKALDEDQAINWDTILPLCQWVVDLDEESIIKSEGDSFDDDPDNKHLKYSVLSLLEKGLSTNEDIGLKIDSVDRTLNMLIEYASHPEPTPEYEERYGGTNMDPLTLSLNTVRPQAIRSLTYLINNFKESNASKRAFEVIEEHIGEKDGSLAVAAAIGEGIGRLFSNDSSWVFEHVDAIFGISAPLSDCQQVSLSTALATHNIHRSLLDIFRKPMLAAIEQAMDSEVLTGWTQNRDNSLIDYIGDWIVRLYVYGLIDNSDDLYIAWFSKTSLEARSKTMSHFAWQIQASDSVSPEIVEKTKELFNDRLNFTKDNPENINELKGLFWLSRCSQIEAEWWLPRLAYVTSLIEDFDKYGLIDEKLAESSERFPDLCLRILENVYDMKLPGGYYRIKTESTPRIIASALSSESFAVRDRANQLMNRFGSDGNVAIRDEVDKLL